MARALLCALLIRLAAAAQPDAGLAAKTPDEELLEGLDEMLGPRPPSEAQAAAPAPAAPPRALPNVTVAGRLCLDLNGDGRCGNDEPLLPGVRLLAAGKQTQTDAEGRFLFEDLPGSATITPATSFELPAGFEFRGALPPMAAPGRIELDFRVRPPKALDDLGSFLVLHLPGGPVRLAVLETSRFNLAEWSEGRPLSARREKFVQKLGTDVLDAVDLRVLVVVEPPSGPARAAYEKAFRGGRAALRYLQGLALVPRARLLWTLAEPGALGGGGGHVDVLLVRVPAQRAAL
jgi:hypothetical protein